MAGGGDDVKPDCERCGGDPSHGVCPETLAEMRAVSEANHRADEEERKSRERSESISRIIDKAAVGSRLALFAAVQAAVGSIVDESRPDVDYRLARIEKALDIGAPYGSPEHLASLEDR